MKKGFTLAEVLITLGIVGVVAALTLPNMIKNHQKRVMVTQLQRTYNAIVNAMPSYMDDVHATSLYDTDAFNRNRNPKDVTPLVNFVKDNFKTSKICTADTPGGTAACYGDEYRRLSGTVLNGFGGDVCTILKTGATVCFYRQWDKNDFPYVNIDVNGPQGPNVWGRDAYQMEFNNAGDIAENFNDNPKHLNNAAAYCEDNIYGGGCFNKIVEDGWVMDY